MSEKKNPLLAGIMSVLPNAISAIVSIVKDKKEKPAVVGTIPETGPEIMVHSVKEIVSGTISGKRLLNIGGTTLIITLAMTDISAHGLSKLNLALICIGAAYSVAMSLITYLSERK